MTGQNYNTGDKHPVHKLLAFVEYEQDGTAIWTSIAEDSMAPFRLARANAQRQLAGKTTYQSSAGTESFRAQESHLASSCQGPQPDSYRNG